MNLRMLALSMIFAAGISAAQSSAAIASDPAVDKANPPSMRAFQIASHGPGLRYDADRRGE